MTPGFIMHSLQLNARLPMKHRQIFRAFYDKSLKLTQLIAAAAAWRVLIEEIICQSFSVLATQRIGILLLDAETRLKR
ncbi:hypothetical protein D3C71_1806750 [compost metagenome]